MKSSGSFQIRLVSLVVLGLARCHVLCASHTLAVPLLLLSHAPRAQVSQIMIMIPSPLAPTYLSNFLGPYGFESPLTIMSRVWRKLLGACLYRP